MMQLQLRRDTEMPKFIQDGPNFYSSTGDHLWTAPKGVVQDDNDIEGAKKARLMWNVHRQLIRQKDVIEGMNNEHPKDPDWGTIYFFWGQLQKIYKGPGAANAAKWTTGETT
jgi:hypothetical protein